MTEDIFAKTYQLNWKLLGGKEESAKLTKRDTGNFRVLFQKF